MEGYLERKLGGRLLSKWQKRFYRINDDVLECYQDDSCSALKGKLQLQGVPSVMTSPNDTRLVIIRLAPSNQTVLELAMRDGDCFEMRAPDAVAAARWVSAIVPFVSASRHGVGQGPPRPGSTRQLLPASAGAGTERRLSQELHGLTHDGFLWKRAIHSGRNWKRRFFTLDGDTLRYSKEPGASTLGTLKLTADCAVDRVAEGESETQYAFRVLLAEHDGDTDAGGADASLDLVGSDVANPAAAAEATVGGAAQAAAAAALAAANTGIRGGTRLVPIFLAAESSPQLDGWIGSLRAAVGALVEERAASQVRRGQTGRLSQAEKEMAEVRAAQRQARAESKAQQQARAPTIAGYGLKRAIGSGRNWKRRYFVLRGHALSYFSDEYDAARAAGAGACGDGSENGTVDTRWGEGAKGIIVLRQGCSTASGQELLRRLVKAAGQRTQARRDGTREGARAHEPCAADADAHMALWEARGGSNGAVPSILELQNAKLDDCTDALDTVLVVIEPKFDETSSGCSSNNLGVVGGSSAGGENTCDVLSSSQRAIYLRFDSLAEREQWQNALQCAMSFEPLVNNDVDNSTGVPVISQASSAAAPPNPPEQQSGSVDAVPVDWVVDVRDSELSPEWTMMQATAFVPAAGFEDGLPRLRLTRMDEAAQTEPAAVDGLEVPLEPTYRRLRLVECCNAPASVNQGDADFGGALYRRLLRKAQISTAWKVHVYADDSGSWRAARVESYNRATNILRVRWDDAPQACDELAFDEMVQLIECLDTPSDRLAANELFHQLRTESETARAAMGIQLEGAGGVTGAEQSVPRVQPAQVTEAVPVDWVVDVRDSELSPEWTMMQATAFVPAAGFEDGLPRLRLSRMDEAAQTEPAAVDGLEVPLEPTYRRLRLVECCSGGTDDFGRVLFTRITGKAEVLTAWKVRIFADDIDSWRAGRVESYNRATSLLRVRWSDAPDELNEHMFDEMVVLVECMDEPSAPQSGPSGTNVAGHCSFELFHVLREEAEAARAALGVEFDSDASAHMATLRSEQCSPSSQRSPTAAGLADTSLHVQMAEARRRASLSIDELVTLQEQELHAAIENAGAGSIQQNVPLLQSVTNATVVEMSSATSQPQEDSMKLASPPNQGNHEAMQTKVDGVTCVEL